MINRRLLLVTALAIASTEALADDRVELSLDNAAPAKGIAEKFGPRWTGLLGRYAQICPVSSPTDGKTVLFVLTVRLDHAYKEGVFEKYPDILVPNPIILSTDLRKIGELPEGFPVDPPGRLRVFFDGWHDNFPTTIRFRQEGSSALEPHSLDVTLIYDRGTGQFRDRSAVL